MGELLRSSPAGDATVVGRFATLVSPALNDSPQSQAIQRAGVVVVDDYQAVVAHLKPINLELEHDPRLPQSSVAGPMSVMGRLIGFLRSANA